MTHGNYKHGMIFTRMYKIWANMKGRCFRKNNINYKNYGGRGIKICKRWLNFENFYEDMREGYSEKLTLDRVDNNGDYEPSNCRWATYKQQCRNTRKNVLYKYGGEKFHSADVFNKFGIKRQTFEKRVRDLGWSVEDAIETPISYNHPDRRAMHYNYRGKKYTIRELSEIFKIHPHTIRYRLKTGKTIEEALHKKVRNYI